MNKLATYIRNIFFLTVCFLASTRLVYAEEDSCKSIDEFTADGSGNNFILEDAFNTIARASVNVINFSWDTFAVPLQAVIALGAAIYVALYTLKNIGSFSQQDTSAYLSNEKHGIIPLAVRASIVLWLLGNQSFIYQYIIGLVVDTGIGIGESISSGGVSLGHNVINSPSSLFNTVISKTKEFNDQIYKVVATGRLLLCLAILPDAILDKFWSLVPLGFILCVYGWMIIIGMSFYMLDVLFRLAVGCIVLPMAIACGFSKLTSTYTKKTWQLFVNVAFNFIMLGILIAFVVKILTLSVASNEELYNLLSSASMTEEDAKQINDHVSTSTFLLVIICCMVGFKLFMGIEQIVSGISDTNPVGNLGKKVGATAAGMAKYAAAKTAKGVAGFGQDVTAAGAQEIRNSNAYQNARRSFFTSRPVRSMSSMYQSMSNSRMARGVRSTKNWIEHALRLDEKY